MKFSTVRTYALLTAMAVVTGPAFAQDNAAAADDGGVGEIVVTAQRQSQSILAVPLSISAVSGDQLAASGIGQMSDLQMTTPGFVPSNSSGYNQMFIRGIGNSIFVGADPSVATFIDDVPRVNGTLVNNFVDVERVEIIKGAPGALYGRNATGGAVNIITRQPKTDKFAATASLSYGELNTFRASAFVNIPLADNIAWTLSGQRASHDAYIKNVVTNPAPFTAAMFPGGSTLLGLNAAQTAAFFNSAQDPQPGYNTESFWAVSTKLMFQPTDTLKITLAADLSKKDDDNGNGAYNINPAFAAGTLAFFLSDPSFGGLTNTTYPLILPVATGVRAPGKFETAQMGKGFVKLDDWGVSGTIVLNTNAFDLTSITSYRKNESDFLTELGFTPFNYLSAHVTLEKKTFYQELRAVSNGDGPLSWIVGASYLTNELSGGLLSGLIPPVPFLQNVPAGQGGYKVTNWSAYAQVGYDVTDNLNVTVSGRYLHETNDATSLTGGRTSTLKLTESKFLPSATVSYKLDGGGNISARWARGFKSGGIVPVDPLSVFPDPLTQGGAFRGEEVDTFEAGVRTPLFNRQAQFTAAVFYNDYRNVQVAAHANLAYQALVSIAVVNAGSARTYGAEASLTARVAEPLTLGASVGYLNAKYLSLRVAPGNPVLDPFDLSGTRMINAPEWQLSFNADLDQPIGGDLRLVGSTVVSHTSRVLWQQSGLQGVLADAEGDPYWLVNARLGVKTEDDKYELAIYAKNLFNSGYTTFGGSTASYGNILIWGDPRIIGVEAKFKF